MLIIDSHIHFWDLSLQKHPWLLSPVEPGFLGDYAPLQQSYLPQHYLHDTAIAPVTQAIHVQAGWDRQDPLGEARWVQTLAQTHALIGGMLAYADFSSSSVETQLTKLNDFPVIKGIRQILGWQDDPLFQATDKDYLNDSLWRKNFGLLKKYGLAFDLQIYPTQVETAYTLLKNHPDIPVVIEHILQPTNFSISALEHWAVQLKKLASLPQVRLKLSGFYLFDHRLHANTFDFLFKTCVDTFSPQRCMFGSNFPVEKLYIPFEALWQHISTAVKIYTLAEQQMIFYQTAKDFYKL